MRLTPDGPIVLSVCGIKEWAGSTRKLYKLRESLDALADMLRISRLSSHSVFQGLMLACGTLHRPPPWKPQMGRYSGGDVSLGQV